MFGVTRTYVLLVAGNSRLKTVAKFCGCHENRRRTDYIYNNTKVCQSFYSNSVITFIEE